MNAIAIPWVEICALADIPNRGCRVVRTPRGRIALFRTAGDEVFALDDRCPHKGGPLSEGIVHGRHVTDIDPVTLEVERRPRAGA